MQCAGLVQGQFPNDRVAPAKSGTVSGDQERIGGEQLGDMTQTVEVSAKLQRGRERWVCGSGVSGLRVKQGHRRTLSVGPRLQATSQFPRASS